jgi:hydrophobe/amphiphile efflux-3 (HAE3) family protein
VPDAPRDTPTFTRMQRFWSTLARELSRRAGLVALVGLLVTLVLGLGIGKLTFATGQDSYLNPEDQVAIDNVDYQSQFGGQAMLVLFTRPGAPVQPPVLQADGTMKGPAAKDGGVVKMMSKANLDELDRIAKELKAHPDLIESVITPRTALDWSDKLVASPDHVPTNSIAGKALVAALGEDKDHTDLRQKDALATVARLNAIPVERQNLDEEAWVDFLIHDNDNRGIRRALSAVFTDENHAQMIVRLKGNSSIEKEGAGADLVRQVIDGARFEGADVTVTGAPVLLKQINDYLRGGMLTLGGIAVVVMAIILLVLFNVRWRLLPLAVVLIGVVWAFGLAGYLGIPLSLVTIAGLPVMLGVGIDYAIQMHARVEEEVALDHAGGPIEITARNLCPALLVVTFDAVFAFAALRFAKVPMIRQFGLLLAIGIAVICLGSIILPLATLGIRERRRPTTNREFKEGPLGRLVVKLGALPKGAGPVLAVLSIVIFIGGALVEDKLVLQTDPVQWVDQSSQAIADYNTLANQTGSANELDIFVKSDDPFKKETVNFVWDYSALQMKAHPKDLLTATNVVTTVGYITELPGAGEVKPHADLVRAAYDVAPEDIKMSTINPEHRTMNIIFRYGTGSLEERKGVLEVMEADTHEPPNVTATPSGLAVVGVGLLENLQSNRVLLTYLAIAFVALFLAVRLKSIVRSLLSLVPVLIAVGTASLVAYVFSLKLSPMTAVGGPLVVAACTEFTSLILLRFIEERARGLDPRAAVDVTAARTGRAFIVSGLTAIAGVAVIGSSQLPLLRDFGIIVAMNVTVALLSALIVLPPLLDWADQRGWVTRGMIPEST